MKKSMTAATAATTAMSQSLKTTLCFLLVHAGLLEGPKSVAFAAQESQKPLLVVSIVRIIVDVAGVLDIQKGLAGRLFNYYLIYLIHN